MQTMTQAAGEPINGGSQSPLLSVEQLVPGAYLSGQTAQYVWRIESVDQEAGVMIIVRQPEPVIAPGHQHAFTLHLNTTCACGWRRQPIRGDDQNGFLPIRPNTPRAHIIRPTGPLVIPDKFNVYVTSKGEIVTAQNGIWSQVLPLIPKLASIWSLPAELRRWVR